MNNGDQSIADCNYREQEKNKSFIVPPGYRRLNSNEIIKKSDIFVESKYPFEKHKTKYGGCYVGYDNMTYIRKVRGATVKYQGKTYRAPKGWRFLRNGEIIKMGDVVFDIYNPEDLQYKYSCYAIGGKQQENMFPSIRKID